VTIEAPRAHRKARFDQTSPTTVTANYLTSTSPPRENHAQPVTPKATTKMGMERMARLSKHTMTIAPLHHQALLHHAAHPMKPSHTASSLSSLDAHAMQLQSLESHMHLHSLSKMAKMGMSHGTHSEAPNVTGALAFPYTSEQPHECSPSTDAYTIPAPTASNATPMKAVTISDQTYSVSHTILAPCTIHTAS
jgi:hypothetical protein